MYDKITCEMNYFLIMTDGDKKKIEVVVSGITPSGNKLHIGNYFGAIQPHLLLQNEVEEAYYFVADLHALTTVQNREQLEKNIRNVILDYLALGLDPDRITFFRQSEVPAHSELAIILSNLISYGQMKRMHAFKDKLQSSESAETINMGLFNYPVLMAADILIYRPEGIPVGEDQRQHIELARDIALNFNHQYGQECLKVPEALINRNKSVAKVVGTDGRRKMSKSLGNVIGIFDEESIIRKQIMSCYTDPSRIKATDPGKVEGNPVFLYHDLLNEDREEVEDLKSRYTVGEVGDVEVKEKLLIAHTKFFSKAKEYRKELENNPEKIKTILQNGRDKANIVAMKNLEEIKLKIGLTKNLF